MPQVLQSPTMLLSQIAALVFTCQLTIAHTLPGLGVLQKQLAARSSNPIDVVYDDLSDPEKDFITDHLKQLTSYNSTKCGQCKNKIRYAQNLLNSSPDKAHLISLTLFKYCIELNKGSESKCDEVDFFIATNSKVDRKFSKSFDSGITGTSSIDFYDNDFLHMLKHFNTSSEEDLEYYCHYKSSLACKVPELGNVTERFNLESWWPAKQALHFSEPDYPANREKFNVLHITDFHIQGRYEVASEANCSSPVCGIPESVNLDLNPKGYNFTDYYKAIDPNLSKFAYSFYPDAHYDEANNYIKGEYYDYPAHRGYNFASSPATIFGGYLTDSPALLMNNSLKYIQESNEQNKYEFALFTGDMVDHDTMHTDAEYTKNSEVEGFQIMKHFLDYIPVFPSLGNHDTFPYGQIAPNSVDFNSSYHWNDELMSDLWVNDGWLPEANRQQIKTHYSGFSYVTNRGLKVISLNSNCYYQKNLWAYIDQSTTPDLFGQWEFLVNELVESEQQNQRVWILAHIPVADYDALPLQSAIFGKIVERFSPYTIANIFWGHTHRDQFHVLYSSNSSKEATDVINMAWVMQSITPLTDNNPSWRYYEVEDKSFNIINSYNYYTHLNETFTNDGDEPTWTFEYSARDFYDPEHSWPTDSPLNASFWHQYVVEPLKNSSDIEFNQKFSEIQYRHSPFTPKCANGTSLSTRCWNENYCIVANFMSTEYQDCLKN